MRTVAAGPLETPASRLMDLWLDYLERENSQRPRPTAASGDDGLEVLKAMVGVMLGKKPLTGRLRAAQAPSHHGLV